MTDQIKDKALKEIRRRVVTATDERERVKLLVLEKAVEKDLMIEQVGEIVDVSGKVFGYAFGLFNAAAETVGDLMAYISASPIVDDGRERFARYAERANQVLKVDEHQKEAVLKLIYTHLGICG